AITGDHNYLDAFIHARLEYRAIQRQHHLVCVGIRRWIVEPKNGDPVLILILNQVAARFSFHRLRFSLCHFRSLRSHNPPRQTLSGSTSISGAKSSASAGNPATKPCRNKRVRLSTNSVTLSLPDG